MTALTLTTIDSYVYLYRIPVFVSSIIIPGYHLFPTWQSGHVLYTTFGANGHRQPSTSPLAPKLLLRSLVLHGGGKADEITSSRH